MINKIQVKFAEISAMHIIFLNFFLLDSWNNDILNQKLIGMKNFFLLPHQMSYFYIIYRKLYSQNLTISI